MEGGDVEAIDPTEEGSRHNFWIHFACSGLKPIWRADSYFSIKSGSGPLKSNFQFAEFCHKDTNFLNDKTVNIVFYGDAPYIYKSKDGKRNMGLSFSMIE